jgi:hypothetical protein
MLDVVIALEEGVMLLEVGDKALLTWEPPCMFVEEALLNIGALGWSVHHIRGGAFDMWIANLENLAPSGVDKS